MKRWASIVVVVGIVAAPTIAAPVRYTFNVTSGSVTVNVSGEGSNSSGVEGGFRVTIFDDDNHIRAGDTFVLEEAFGAHGNLRNTDTMKVSLAGLATATLNAGSFRYLDFGPVGSSEIPSGGGPVTVNADLYYEASVFVTGLTTTTFSEKFWAKTLLPWQMYFSTSVGASHTVTAGLFGTSGYEVGISDIGLTITLDLILDVEGTAHVVPDPALGGLIVLGIGGAGAWFRSRR